MQSHGIVLEYYIRARLGTLYALYVLYVSGLFNVQYLYCFGQSTVNKVA